MRVKLITPHRKGCESEKAVKDGKWESPWAYVDGDEWRSASGRRHKHGGTLWVSVKCNDHSCDARVLVESDSLMNDIQNELSKTK